MSVTFLAVVVIRYGLITRRDDRTETCANFSQRKGILCEIISDNFLHHYCPGATCVLEHRVVLRRCLFGMGTKKMSEVSY